MFVLIGWVKLWHYPRVCGSEVLCLLSRSGWARFLLRPVGTDQSVCTDRWEAAHQQPPLHLRQDSAAPFPRGRSLRPGWSTWRYVKKTAGTIWNGNPENWPNRKQFLKPKDRSLCRTDFQSWTRIQSVLMPVLCNEFNWFKSRQLFFFFFLQIDWIPQFIWTICS